MAHKKNKKIKLNMLDSLMSIPSPSSISYMWNFGSLLLVCMVLQVVTGLILSTHYSCDTSMAFTSVDHISRDVNSGWLTRSLHANGASSFFMCMYIHIGRGMYYGSYLWNKVWLSGLILLLMVMMTAFLGYVLPWGQMSFWGATVITNLASAVPWVGSDIVFTLWGGFSVDNATLTRFFTIHYIIPLLMVVMVSVHLMFLHKSGSSSPLGLNSNFDKTYFHSYFTLKDFLGVMYFLLVMTLVTLQFPTILSDPENFMPADSLSTPIHIQPEWYFLFAYAILRAVPNKLGGVLALVSSILILTVLPFYGGVKFKSKSFNPNKKFFFWTFIVVVLGLTVAGAKPVEDPYIIISQILTLMYFFYFIMTPWEEYI